MEQGVKLKVSDISSLRAQRQISGLSLPEVTLTSIRQCEDAIAGLKVSIEELDNRLKAVVDGIEAIRLLDTIPGVGLIWSTTIYAEVGDIRRFRSRKAFASYTGLIPSIRASGEKIHHGNITHNGSRPLRHALVEAGIHAVKKSRSLRRLHDRVLYRGNIQKARVAVARKLSLIIYAMLRNGEAFRVDHT
jgi:transposase